MHNYNDIDKNILSIINGTIFQKENSYFFNRATTQKKFDAILTYQIAYNWREVTKKFLFSTIKGLGLLAEKIGAEHDPSSNVLHVLQTSFSIISDDLSNTHQIFKKSAPSGSNGTHYKWWEDSILTPLNHQLNMTSCDLTSGTQALIKNMEKLADNYLGTPVILRVVEAIALEICEAFINIFSKTEYNGKKIFDINDLAWITSHIKAEKIHHAQVNDEQAGMIRVIRSSREKDNFLNLIQGHADAWKLLFLDFSNFL